MQSWYLTCSQLCLKNLNIKEINKNTNNSIHNQNCFQVQNIFNNVYKIYCIKITAEFVSRASKINFI